MSSCRVKPIKKNGSFRSQPTARKSMTRMLQLISKVPRGTIVYYHLILLYSTKKTKTFMNKNKTMILYLLRISRMKSRKLSRTNCYRKWKKEKGPCFQRKQYISSQYFVQRACFCVFHASSNKQKCLLYNHQYCCDNTPAELKLYSFNSQMQGPRGDKAFFPAGEVYCWWCVPH